MRSVLVVGTGLIGASVGLALRAAGFDGEIVGWDKDQSQVRIAFERGAVSVKADDALTAAGRVDVVLLAGPVFSILEWMERLSPVLQAHQLVTDVGSVKSPMMVRASVLYGAGRAQFLGGHPMAGKEAFGAEHADGELFRNAVWLFTPTGGASRTPPELEWRGWVERCGARVQDIDAVRHDEVCAWLSHMPQMLGTALSALYDERFGDAEDARAIGGRAMREMTRLGASPYSMWRDIAHLNGEAIAESMTALEQRLAHVRENLRTPQLREEFEQANRFRGKYPR